MRDFSIVDFGAINDGATLNTEAINKAITAAAAESGRVIVPAGGTFLSGSIILKGAIEFHLEEGAVLKASGEYGD